MNRRDFLHPRRLAHSAASVLGVVEELQTLVLKPTAEETALLRFSRSAMATTFEVLLPFGSEGAAEMAAAALDEIDRMEDQLTVYRPDSEVSRLNQRAPREAVTVDEGLFGLLQEAARIYRDTEGAFDVTAGALTKTWGFFRRQGRVPDQAELTEALDRLGMSKVLLDPEARTVRYLRPGIDINLGSIGKGYALDRAGGLLRSHGFVSALIHGGHSSIYAVGSEPGNGEGWPVGIRHPWKQEQRLALLQLRDRGLATSAATFQHLEYNGRKLGHIVDPRTGWPAEGVASATVTAPTAAEADALATAFFILGAQKAEAYCEAHPEIGALLLPDGDDAVAVVLGFARHEVAPSQ